MVGSCEHDNEPSGPLNVGNLTSSGTITFSRGTMLQVASHSVT